MNDEENEGNDYADKDDNDDGSESEEENEDKDDGLCESEYKGQKESKTKYVLGNDSTPSDSNHTEVGQLCGIDVCVISNVLNGSVFVTKQ